MKDKEIRIVIANEIDSLQAQIDKEAEFSKRMLLRLKWKALFTCLLTLNEIKDKEIKELINV